MNVVIGYDINEYYAQISYAGEGREPETLQFPTRKEEGNIETALCKRKGVNQWFCGKEAVKKGVAGEGTLVEQLWKLFATRETVVIEKQEFSTTRLFNLFLKRTLAWSLQRIEELVGEPVKVKALVLTAEPWQESMLPKFSLVTEGLPVEKECIFFQGHEESLFSYLVHQPERLLGYETGVFDLTGETLISYRVQMNHKTSPVVTTMDREVVTGIVRKKHYASIREQDEALTGLDYRLKEYVEDFTEGRIVTSLYLIGEGFRGDWYKESRKLLCRNRKVYAGNNLFGKGACYSGAERIWPGDVSENFLFFGKEMLRYNVGLTMQSVAGQEYYPLLDAGTNWYEAGAELSFMMEKPDEIALQITPLDGSGSYTERLKLPDFPGRDLRAFRFCLKAEMESETKLRIRVMDEGFGQIFASTGMEMEYRLVLGNGKE